MGEKLNVDAGLNVNIDFDALFNYVKNKGGNNGGGGGGNNAANLNKEGKAWRKYAKDVEISVDNIVDALKELERAQPFKNGKGLFADVNDIEVALRTLTGELTDARDDLSDLSSKSADEIKEIFKTDKDSQKMVKDIYNLSNAYQACGGEIDSLTGIIKGLDDALSIAESAINSMGITFG